MAYVVRLLRVLLLALLGVSSGHLAALANATGQLRTAPGYVYDGVANTAHARLETTASPAGATRTAASTWTSSVSGSPASVASVVAANSEAGAAGLEEAFHYTSPEAARSIAREGLRAGGFATPAGDLSPLQAQLELALNPTRALPESVVRIDVAGLREAGFDIPEVTRVSNVVRDWSNGRVYTMPGGGWEMQFPDWIPPEFLKVVR